MTDDIATIMQRVAEIRYELSKPVQSQFIRNDCEWLLDSLDRVAARLADKEAPSKSGLVTRLTERAERAEQDRDWWNGVAEQLAEDNIPHLIQRVKATKARSRELTKALERLANSGPWYGNSGESESWVRWASEARAILAADPETRPA